MFSSTLPGNLRVAVEGSKGEEISCEHGTLVKPSSELDKLVQINKVAYTGLTKTVNPKSQTPNPSPRTLHCTLHYTWHLTPYTLNPIRFTLTPKTLNSRPSD